ncbi:hypothetical protein SAMN04487859_1614 [Roseovarius lutimaris]|uniref:Uncharacterized protein n=1 Tax=Roseovarius lutimaris TaxID=1005928 RepID=A0A1I5H905_9RHOB|nr:hypothetical protein SAMN04487859_1614 [Roseovarius lutimaris]
MSTYDVYAILPLASTAVSDHCRVLPRRLENIGTQFFELFPRSWRRIIGKNMHKADKLG